MSQSDTPSGPLFEDLGLSDTMLQSLKKMGFESPSPIQAGLIPIALTGKDCIGQAHTGTGKTASFVIPVLEHIDYDSKRPLALILTPTRELAEQVANEARKLSANRKVGVVSIVGGKSIRAQVDELNRGAQIAVGTPGRVIDLMNRRQLDLSTLDFVILDEADRMLDIGFRPDIEKILKRCPDERQTLLLSATLPPPVERLAQRYMKQPEMVDLSQDAVVTALRATGADDWMCGIIADYYALYTSGWSEFTTDAVQRITGHPARSIDDFAREVVLPMVRAMG